MKISAQPAPENVDEYIAGFPEAVQEILEKIRKTIQQTAPEAHESIKYRMPAYRLNGFLVSFAAYKKHIGLYPAVSGDDRFNQALSGYLSEKSTVRLPLDEPIPYDLIGQLVRYRLKVNLANAAAKTKDD